MFFLLRIFVLSRMDFWMEGQKNDVKFVYFIQDGVPTFFYPGKSKGNHNIFAVRLLNKITIIR